MISKDYAALRVGLDSNILSYLVEAMASGYEPNRDDDGDLREERVAALRIFLYVGNLFVTPTAHREAEMISDPVKRSYHDAIKNVLLSEIVGLDEGLIEARTKDLMNAHPREQDCRIVAESELGGLTQLLTLDTKMFSRLAEVSEVELSSASSFWTSIDLPQGAQPRWEPRADNPLADVDWWRW
jgi:hypothetical protein